MNRFWLSDETHNSTEVFTTGSTLFIEGQDLHPSTRYDFHLTCECAEAKRVLLARYRTDSYGRLAATPLIPSVGLSLLGAIQVDTYAESYSGDDFIVRARVSGTEGLEFEDLRFCVSRRYKAPRVFPCGRNARQKTGIEKGSGPVAVALHNFPAGPITVFCVPWQSGWRVGDAIKPVASRNGKVCSSLIDHDGATERVVILSESRDVPAGRYQFIARTVPQGLDTAGYPFLLRDDVVSDRHAASLIIRLPFNTSRGREMETGRTASALMTAEA